MKKDGKKSPKIAIHLTYTNICLHFQKDFLHIESVKGTFRFCYYLVSLLCYQHLFIYEYDLELIRYPLKCTREYGEARNGYNFIRDDALQVAVCVIAIFLDILYGNLLYVIHYERRKKKSLCLYSHSTNCEGMNKICFSCNILSSLGYLVCSQVF